MKRCEMRQNNEGSAWELNERPFSYAYCAFHWSHDAIHCMSKIMMRMNIVKRTSHSSWEFKAIGHFLCQRVHGTDDGIQSMSKTMYDENLEQCKVLGLW